MKSKKVLKKLDLFKEKVSALTPTESKKLQGGIVGNSLDGGFGIVSPTIGSVDFFGSRLVCTQTKAEVGCTAHTACNGTATPGTIVIFCS